MNSYLEGIFQPKVKIELPVDKRKFTIDFYSEYLMSQRFGIFPMYSVFYDKHGNFIDAANVETEILWVDHLPSFQREEIVEIFQKAPDKKSSVLRKPVTYEDFLDEEPDLDVERFFNINGYIINPRTCTKMFFKSKTRIHKMDLYIRPQRFKFPLDLSRHDLINFSRLKVNKVATIGKYKKTDQDIADIGLGHRLPEIKILKTKRKISSFSFPNIEPTYEAPCVRIKEYK